MKSILETYNLPSIFYLFDKQMSKAEWKQTLTKVVNSHTESIWRAKISRKSSLKYVHLLSLKVGKTHPIWATVRNSIVDNKGGGVRRGAT